MDNTSGNADDVESVFCKVPVDPIWDVEGPIEAESKDVVDGQEIAFALALKHKQLG